MDTLRAIAIWVAMVGDFLFMMSLTGRVEFIKINENNTIDISNWIVITLAISVIPLAYYFARIFYNKSQSNVEKILKMKKLSTKNTQPIL